jgi:hypothetical protein
MIASRAHQRHDEPLDQDAQAWHIPNPYLITLLSHSDAQLSIIIRWSTRISHSSTDTCKYARITHCNQAIPIERNTLEDLAILSTRTKAQEWK